MLFLDLTGVSSTHLGSFKLKELGYVVEHGGNNGNNKQEALPREVLQRMHDREIAFYCHRHRHKNGAHSSDVTDAKTYRHYKR